MAQGRYVFGSPPGGEGGPGGGDSIIVDEGDGQGYWALVGNTYYVRDVGGKEIAIYSSGGLIQWNIWGLDQIGHMNADTTKYYYLKDHLGSTRAVINSTNTVVSAQDFDAWGYIMQDRTYQPENSKYKFTGKERDKDLESNYDYFGARYYDSRIGRWVGVDSLFMKHYDYSPFNYAIDNPLKYIDPNGKQVDVTDPFYHISKETKTIQEKVLETHQNLERFAEKSWPLTKVVLSYGGKVMVGVVLRETVGLTRNIPFIAIVAPSIATIIATTLAIIHATSPELGKGEEELIREYKKGNEEQKEKPEDSKVNEKIPKGFKYFRDFNKF